VQAGPDAQDERCAFVTRAQVMAELALVAKAIDEGKLSSRDGVELAYAIGCETERQDAMDRACHELDRARTAREAAFRRHLKGDFRHDRAR
jgi:hypothetical protein